MQQTQNKIPCQKKFVILFDEACKLCNNVVRFISKNDIRSLFCFVPLNSELAKEYIMAGGKDYFTGGSLVFIEEGRYYTKSEAVLHILKHLDKPWPLLYIFIILPAFIRDPFYDLIARYRYRWFGLCTDCQGPGSG